MNEQNMKLQTVRERCQKSAKVIWILQIFAIIGIVASLIGAVSCFALKNTINTGLAEQIASGKATVDSFKFGNGLLSIGIDYDEAFKSGNYATPMAINCVIAVIITLASFYLLSIFKRIFNDLVKEDNPFADTILSGLKKCFIVATVIMIAFVGIGPGIIGGLLFWCIYSVFEYGKVLQTEVDETL